MGTCEPGFGFVVLHYLAPEMTRRCVDALLQMHWNASVVIVDNASPDGSGAVLKAEYAAKKEVTVLCNPSNLGFARGNNVGYDYLVKKGGCNFIVVMNNDVIIDDPLFPGKVAEIYSQTAFAVLGPDVLNPVSGIHQSPVSLESFKESDLREVDGRYAGYLRNYYWKRFKWSLKKALLHSGPKKHKPAVFYTGRMEGAVLHGACFVFSEIFISARPYCFNPSTFMYLEEGILQFECMRDGLKMVYDPSLRVLHFEDVSTDVAFGSEARKDRFKFEQTRKSIAVLLDLMK